MKLADGMIFIGGGAGTLVEIAHWAKMNKSRADRKRPLIPAVPIAGVGGWSDWLAWQGLVQFPEFARDAIPKVPITSGAAAVAWLLVRMNVAHGDRS